jgi:predicted transcriptional regulator
MHLEKIQAWLRLSEMDSEGIVAALFELTETEAKAYFMLLKKQMSVQDLCNKMRKDRTTAQRVLQKLVHKGLAHRVVVRKKGGGINYTYKPISLMETKDKMQEMVDSWSNFLKSRIKSI